MMLSWFRSPREWQWQCCHHVQHQSPKKWPIEENFLHFFVLAKNCAIRSPGAPRSEFSIHPCQNPNFWRVSKNVKKAFFFVPRGLPREICVCPPRENLGARGTKIPPLPPPSASRTTKNPILPPILTRNVHGAPWGPKCKKRPNAVGC